MIYTIISILIIISYLFGVYIYHQGEKSAVERPVGFSDSVQLILMVLFVFAPIIIAVYLGYKISGIGFGLIILLIRFAVLPMFNNRIVKLLTKNRV